MKNFVERENKEGSEEIKEAIKTKKNPFRKMCKIRSKENKNNYKKERNLTRNIVSRAMRREAE